MTARFSPDPPLAPTDSEPAQPTTTEMAAVVFVKEMAAHVDEKNGRTPMRETQKKVAAIVRENCFTPTPSANSWAARRPPALMSECPDCGAPPSATQVLDFYCEHDRCPMIRPPRPARAAICAALRAQATKTARAMIKLRARAYALRPRELDAICEGLSSAAPAKLVELLATVIRYSTNRNFGFGGEIPAINLKAGMLYARYLRAKAHQIAKRAA